MPRTKKAKTTKPLATRTVRRTPVRPSIERYQKNPIDWSQSYTSLLLGVVVVIVGVLFVASIIRSHNALNQETSSISTQKLQPTPTPATSTYTVQEGDNLWSIAIKFYNNGYAWTKIAEANKLTTPGSIDKGQTLIIPTVQPTPATSFGDLLTPTPAPSTQPVAAASNAISGSTYVVEHGDNLWDIAVRAYADGYKWPEIAKANHLANPGLIFSGNVLIIPR